MTMGKSVLFVRNIKRTDNYAVPHLGLALLCAALKSRGHRPAVLDYLLFLGKRPPGLREIISKFRPDVLAMSLYTSTIGESVNFLREFKKLLDIPVIVGGPHATLYAEELTSNRIGDYIIKGEAEVIISDIVEKAACQETPRIIDAPRPDMMKDILLPDFRYFLNYENIRVYPLQTSRGCPYLCSFCAVRCLAGQTWRKRDIKACLGELMLARTYLSRLRVVKIVDDAPTVDRDRFKDFLKDYISEDIGLEMIIDNVRADSVDEELVALAKRAHNRSLCIAVEHADPDIFKSIGKSESLGQIEKAAESIKKAGLNLGLCFIIGLPGDNFERTIKSVRFAKELKADFIYWNMVHPMKCTEIRDCFIKEGATLYPDDNYTSFDCHTLKSPRVVVETDDFPAEERKRAYFAASVFTGQYHLNIREIYYLIKYGLRYKLLKSAILSFVERMVKLRKYLNPYYITHFIIHS